MIECRGRNKWFQLFEARGWITGGSPNIEATAHVSLRSKTPYRDMPPIYFSGPVEEVVAVLTRIKNEILEEHLKQFGGWWGEHPKYSRRDWNGEAGDNNTGLGYWDWVLNRIDQEQEPEPQICPTCRGCGKQRYAGENIDCNICNGTGKI